jgi:23S rRNA (pseudouridine1915-N3)-methyltransferase
MKWKILAVGKPKLPFIAAGIEEYTKRILRFTHLETVYIPTDSPDHENAEFIKKSADSFKIVLDERGKQLTSRQLSDLIQKWEINSVRNVSVMIGGPDGHREEIRQIADLTLSLSQMTLQHETALLIALEQIYRAYTILAGLPYHRD